MYHQVIHTGEDALRVVVEYEMEEDAYAVITRIEYEGREVPVGIFDLAQIEAMASQIESGHADVLRELHAAIGESIAEERQAFRDAYGD